VTMVTMPETMHGIVGYDDSRLGADEMHIMGGDMGEGAYNDGGEGEVRAFGQEGEMRALGDTEDVRALGQEQRAGMDVQGRMVRPGPPLDVEEVMALGVDEGDGGDAHIMDTGEVRALGH